MAGIQLGLQRITTLLKDTPIPWKAVHIAGTNGKGSVCNCTSHLLRASGVRSGTFTSPHLIDRWDCITLDGRSVSQDLFLETETRVKRWNEERQLQATSFEILTATAFEIFTSANVKVAVIEVGMGGLEDATNVISNPTPAVITKLGLDHEDILGKGIESIVKHKAGIMKPGSLCLVDGTNSADVIKMLEMKAEEHQVESLKVCYLSSYANKSLFASLPGWTDLPDHKKMHLILGYEAASIAIQKQDQLQPDWSQVLTSSIDLSFPGRQQSISIQNLTGRSSPVLLDGCHNAQSAAALKQIVDKKYRTSPQRDGQSAVTWVIAASRSKDVDNIFGQLIQEGDSVVITEFGTADGMPWVLPKPAEMLGVLVQKYKPKNSVVVTDLLDALKRATDFSAGSPLVIAGSLYLVSDVLRLLRSHDSAEAMPEDQIHNLGFSTK